MVNRSLGADYSNGAQGADVMKIQQALELAGFSPGPIDGMFGSRTKTAVMSFQSAQGITIDGIVGSVTWERLLKGAPAPGQRPPTITLPAPTILAKPSMFGNLFSGLGSTTSLLGLGLGLVLFMSIKRRKRR